jgi:UDP-N-acetylmuramyl pentapeptide phosphotransferase/UDP-N-acetylglucosamine-1-phosphate transferase
MRRALLGGMVSTATTLAVAPIVRCLLVRHGSMDIPNHRSSHTVPVPRGGGIACALGVAAGIAATGRAALVPRRTSLGLAALTLTGLADDQIGHLHPVVRLVVQALAGASFGPAVPLIPASSLATAGVVNVVNFMDGINGISGGTAIVWGVYALSAGREVQDPMLQTIGATTAGAGLGFLPWNAPKAQLFLGDVGSYLLGGLMAAGITHASPRPTVAWRVAAPLLPYAVDASQALIRRALSGEPLTEAHRGHVYQRLVDERGLSHAQASMLHASVATLMGALARRPPSAITAVTIVTCLSMYLASPTIIRLLEGSCQDEDRSDHPVVPTRTR